MKSLDLGRYALSTCVAAALLSGCGGSPPPISAPGAMGKYAASANQPDSVASSTTEFLYTRRVKETCFGNNYGCNCVFHTSGKASGPFSGTFTASGNWNATSNEPWKFSENFSIKSTGKVISGTVSGQGAHPQMEGGCVSFGPHIMTYSVGSHNGKVRVRFRWHHVMLEHLQNLQH
ncbi:MAG TPA: hypothetical protein VK755_04975 [Candidatus Acidoferrales bacterium]|jgi:hypothetical protein|nr:hypothetical protein [Candidatus Acidoferrales bacterium]